MIAQAIFDAASTIGCEVMLIEMLPRAHSGMEPPKAIAEAMRIVDVVIAPTSKSLSHTQARSKCGCGGARMATMPGITEGKIVVDGTISELGLLSSPIEITVENRYVSEIKGERADALMIGNSLEDEKIGGTIHVGLGDSSTIGGDVMAGIHLDAVITKPMIFVDGRELKIDISQ